MSVAYRLTTYLSALMLSLGLAAAPALAAEAGHHDHGHGAEAATLSLDDGRKWATDTPLRKAMARIRKAVDASLHAIHEDKLRPSGYGSLARTINGEVGYMVSNCKLEPRADAQLHLIIAEMLAGAELMAAKGVADGRRDGAIRVVGALAKYGEYFDDPGWKRLDH